MRISKFSAIFVAFAFVAVVTGCHHTIAKNNNDNHGTPPKITAPAPSANMTVKPDTVDKGQQAELSWNTQNASTITIDGIGTVSASGSRKITPDSSTTYHLTAQGEGGSTDASARITVNIPTVTTSGLTKKQAFEQNVKDVFFSYDNFDIREDELQVISADADYLAKNPDMKFVIEGHCDERGSDEYNMGLGENRANKVLETLKQHGVSEDRIKIISYGKERPFCKTGEDESCWQQNRVAHFSFVE